MALRDDSDAHTGGTDDFDSGMFGVHVTAAVLRFLSKTEPFTRG